MLGISVKKGKIMNGFREKLIRFMYGRYGFDQLGKFLMGAGFVMAILSIPLRFLPTHIPYVICSSLNSVFYIVAFFRILSRNIMRRTAENEQYLRIRNKVLPFLDEKTKNINCNSISNRRSRKWDFNNSTS